MEYRKLGKAGIKLSAISFGSWVTFGSSLGIERARRCMHTAFEQGINFFDNAEVYASGESERIMGEILKDFRREDLVVSTKIFWGGDGPNDEGLSWKHLVEGTKNSLKRLQLEYVDLLFCHRPDPETPIEETVRAMDFLIRSGYAFYWGTSEWPANAIEEAFQIAEQHHCIPPSMEQPQYNMFVRERFEHEYAPLYERYQLGTTIWSPLASGALTGKYLGEKNPKDISRERAQWVARYLDRDHLERVEKLKVIADDLGCTLAQLSIAWCLKNPNVSTVITGASGEEQLLENVQALPVMNSLSSEVLDSIDQILRQSDSAIR